MLEVEPGAKPPKGVGGQCDGWLPGGWLLEGTTPGGYGGGFANGCLPAFIFIFIFILVLIFRV